MPIPIRLPKSSAWKVQCLVLQGLFFRECKTRFGKGYIGLFFTLFQPVATVVVLGVILGSLLERRISAIPYPMFLLLGFLPFNLFKGIITSSLTCFQANQGLLVHQKVRPTDPIFARIFYQFFVASLSFLLFIFIATWFFDAKPDFSNSIALVGAGAAVILMGGGLGIFFAIAAFKRKFMERAVPIVLQPLLYISCVLYPLQVVPSSHQGYLLWNPLVHINEALRLSLYPHYRTGDVNLLYPLMVGVILFWLGMAYYRVNREILYNLGG